MTRPFAAVLGALALVAALAPAAARAQGGLERIDSLAAAGRADEAREALLDWWDRESPGAPRPEVQRALWLRGLLTVDPRQAALDYQRLVVEYPGGPFTDAALLRLAQAERASGRPGRALDPLRILVRDYPSSPHGLRARTLLAEVEAETASRGSDAGAEPAGPPEAPAPVASGAFAIQLGAFSTAERAQGLLTRARAAGLKPRLVRVVGSGLVRVRADRFAGREDAERRLREVRARGFDAMVVDDAGAEEAVVDPSGADQAG